MGRGNLLHRWFSGDDDADTRVLVAPPEVKARRGAKWKAAQAVATLAGASSVVTQEDRAICTEAWQSLIRSDTPAKQQILAILRRWSPRIPEVSHRWEPFEGCVCRIREDAVARTPSSGVWAAVQLKTTEASLATWWRYWHRYVRISSSFYRRGLIDLFGRRGFHQVLVVARLTPPYPWAVFSLESYASILEDLWTGELVANLQMITDALQQSELYGPEERGITCLN